VLCRRLLRVLTFLKFSRVFESFAELSLQLQSCHSLNPGRISSARAGAIDPRSSVPEKSFPRLETLRAGYACATLVGPHMAIDPERVNALFLAVIP
jgi:hypothetical protein